ncbi:MAG: DNA methyltransferase [Anaerolineae bacterium]|nr:DNA methyltransferase [Anaerolineae bacterium]
MARITNVEANKLAVGDRAFHDWYRFVLSFPPHLVARYLDRFGAQPGMIVLDPFAGTGTTLVEAKKRGLASVGVEANPMAHFAAATKTDWRVDPGRLIHHAEAVAAATQAALAAEGIEDSALLSRPAHTVPLGALRTLSPDQHALLLTNSISPLPLHKTLTLLEHIERDDDEHLAPYEKLALASALVNVIGNVRFGPEIGIGAIKGDADVLEPWLHNVRKMARDVAQCSERNDVRATVHRGDARLLDTLLEPHSIDLVITSPPYPNEKDYTRTTRLESVILGFIRDKRELQAFKRNLLRSNTRNVYKGDDDDTWIAQFPEIQSLAQAIEARRIALGKTSGFERLYARVTTLYFGGMARHLAGLRHALRPGARLAYVVGDQASYLRVMIRTGALLGQIAERLGYQVEGVDLFRTRLATATREQLREEVVVLRWPGHSQSS